MQTAVHAAALARSNEGTGGDLPCARGVDTAARRFLCRVTFKLAARLCRAGFALMPNEHPGKVVALSALGRCHGPIVRSLAPRRRVGSVRVTIALVVLVGAVDMLAPALSG
jgi:hypothetical protein